MQTRRPSLNDVATNPANKDRASPNAKSAVECYFATASKHFAQLLSLSPSVPFANFMGYLLSEVLAYR